MVLSDLPRCKRQPNEMAGVTDFLRACSDPTHPRNRKPRSFKVTETGSINEDGREDSFHAISLTPFHIQFAECLEPEIAPLVDALFKLGFIPYTSCQGHLIDNQLHEAHVGLLSLAEYEPEHFDILLARTSNTSIQVLTHSLYDSAHLLNYPTVELYIQDEDIGQTYSD